MNASFLKIDYWNIYWPLNFIFLSICSLASAEQQLAGNELQCQKSELLLFFPKQTVEKALVQAKINQQQAEEIALELSDKNKELEKKIKERTEVEASNSLIDLSQRDKLLKVYQELIYEVFSTVLKKNGIKDDERVRELLEKVREAKSKQFIECIQASH
jgi:hypothetical protein